MSALNFFFLVYFLVLYMFIFSNNCVSGFTVINYHDQNLLEIITWVVRPSITFVSSMSLLSILPTAISYLNLLELIFKNFVFFELFRVPRIVPQDIAVERMTFMVLPIWKMTYLSITWCAHISFIDEIRPRLTSFTNYGTKIRHLFFSFKL